MCLLPFFLRRNFMSSVYLTRYTLKVDLFLPMVGPRFDCQRPPGALTNSGKQDPTCHSRWLPPVAHPVVRRDQNHCRKELKNGRGYPVPKKIMGNMKLETWETFIHTESMESMYMYIPFIYIYMLDGCSSLVLSISSKETDKLSCI